VIRACGKNCLGFLDDRYPEIDVLGKIGDMESIAGISYLYTLMTVKKQRERYELFTRLLPVTWAWPLVHPQATVSKDTYIGLGSVVMPGARIAAGAHIGDHVLVFENAVIDHDAWINSFATIANSASVGADVYVGTGAHIGSNSVIIEHNQIGVFSIVGSGSVITHDVPADATAMGNPARF
jgi:sugar O-acyltransferase (sialic acid O-acetyltransferase NeuD family)